MAAMNINTEMKNVVGMWYKQSCFRPHGFSHTKDPTTSVMCVYFVLGTYTTKLLGMEEFSRFKPAGYMATRFKPAGYMCSIDQPIGLLCLV